MALKYLLTVACVLMNFIEQYQAIECTEVSGILKQIDAGLGMVVGVNLEDAVFERIGTTWIQLPGTLSHVSVGPAGIWGARTDSNIYKLVAGDFVRVPGRLLQIDAGGEQFVAGVNDINEIWCMQRYTSVEFGPPKSPAPWDQVPGLFTYYSCGPIGCWAVDKNQLIYFRGGLRDVDCVGDEDWKIVPGMLVMIEAATDGSVYGVNVHGDVYRRDGVSDSDLLGTEWTMLSEVGKAKHVSYDLGHLWVITPENKIMDCIVDVSY